MPDPLTPQQRHTCMSHIRSKNTKPEVKLRRELFRRGYRYRINVKGLGGTPDIVLAKYRTCIFVNGCFWHGHDGCRFFTHPKTNPEFWEEKVKRNRERDLLVNTRLETLGWSVITIWECELKKAKLEDTLSQVEEQLARNLQYWEAYRQKRKEDRAFALEENRRRKAVREEIEAELQKEFRIPKMIIRMSRDFDAE